tara:strand:- start:120 stop:479 length:360 start_codon:yes stop_codon:yes gene_type:complete
MPKSKASKRRIDKYAGNSPQLRDSGFLVKQGGSDEIAHHYRRHFHQFLDYLTIDPSAPNPLDQVGDGEPALRDAMRRAGIAGLTRNELLKKRDRYVARLDAGKARYSSKLHRVEWIPAN